MIQKLDQFHVCMGTSEFCEGEYASVKKSSMIKY